jgi:hypothetical protein
MPNHVYTNMSIEGTVEEVKNFFMTHFTEDDGGDSFFDLSTFFPMPEELQGTVSPNRPPRVNGQEALPLSPEYKAWVANCKRLVEAYGADNWYDWHIQNWGTKWNTYDNCIHDDNNVSFQTAWSLPDPIFAKMAEMYPSMTFNIECVEEGGFFAGTILISEGKVKEDLYADPEKWKEYARVQMPWWFDDEE